MHTNIYEVEYTGSIYHGAYIGSTINHNIGGIIGNITAGGIYKGHSGTTFITYGTNTSTNHKIGGLVGSYTNGVTFKDSYFGNNAYIYQNNGVDSDSFIGSGSTATIDDFYAVVTINGTINYRLDNDSTTHGVLSNKTTMQNDNGFDFDNIWYYEGSYT